jgi:hypothetical protein
MTALLDKLRAQPGIDVRRLKAGTRLLIETAQHVYEMVVIVPHATLLEISSTDPVLRRPTVGQFLAGHYPASTDVEGWIGRGLSMVIRFRNGCYRSGPVLSAQVKGDTWHYTVFETAATPGVCP